MENNSNIIRSTSYARGTVWWVDLINDPMCTTFQRFKRPCLIISNDEFNIQFGKVTVIPLSHKQKYTDWENVVITAWGSGNSYILCDQIRQIDVRYLSEYAFTVHPKCMKQIEKLLYKFYFVHKDEAIEINDNSTVNDTTTSKVTTSAVVNKNSEDTKSKTELIADMNDQLIEISKTNEQIINKAVNCLKEKVGNMVNKVNNTNYVVDTVANEAVVRHNAKSVVNSIKNTHTKKYNKTTKSNTESNKRSSSMPYKFFTSLDNNIDFWNDLVTYGKEEVCIKYKLLDDAQFLRRKSRVKVFLKKNGYNPTLDKLIERK